MAHRLEDGSRTITWTESREIAVGYHDCSVCGAETPTPTMDAMIEYAKSTYRGGFMWPSDSREQPGCMPVGWTWTDNGWLCVDCTASVAAALAARAVTRQKGG